MADLHGPLRKISKASVTFTYADGTSETLAISGDHLMGEGVIAQEALPDLAAPIHDLTRAVVTAWPPWNLTLTVKGAEAVEVRGRG